MSIFRTYWNKLRNQGIYQGKSKMRNYFEGWYFKLVSNDQNHVIAVIPGISFDENKNGYAFIQIFDGVHNKMDFIKFSLDEFDFKENKFEIRIGKSIFTENYIDLNLQGDLFKVRGRVDFENQYPWPNKLLEPGVMGWYRYVPKMECYHGVLSFDHILNGTMIINEITIDFKEGKGYIEKDYGTSFPTYYLWMQSNHFGMDQTSIMVSFAKIPWLRSYFDGFIAGFLLQGKLYKFTTYTGAKVSKLQIHDTSITIHLLSKNYRLEVDALKSEPIELQSPVLGSMTGRILESIKSKLHVKLYQLNKEGEQLLFSGIGSNSGLDIGGNIDDIPRI